MYVTIVITPTGGVRGGGIFSNHVEPYPYGLHGTNPRKVSLPFYLPKKKLNKPHKNVLNFGGAIPR